MRKPKLFSHTHSFMHGTLSSRLCIPLAQAMEDKYRNLEPPNHPGGESGIRIRPVKYRLIFKG